MHPLAALYPQENSWYSFLLEAVFPWATVWLEGLGHLKNLMISAGIKTATYQLLA
jgi:hypothetical protein